MSLSNPIVRWLDGSTLEKFTYEGGSQLVHFSAADCGFTEAGQRCNIVFFANSEEHGLDVLKRMLTFIVEEPYESHFYESRNKFVTNILNNFDKVRISIAPTNQAFLVGWALNDSAF